MFDIYFAPEYGEICEFIDSGKCEIFQFQSTSGTIKNMYIKREIPWKIDSKRYFDIITPYGYGGPIICEAINKEQLIQEYYQAFQKHCDENDIVCEFVRFHPIYKNYEDFQDIYKTVYLRHTVGTNLKEYDDPIQNEFSKSTRRDIRKSLEKGVECSIHLAPHDWTIFKKLYNETLERNHAAIQYFFPDEYYEKINLLLGSDTLEIRAHYKNEVIASEMYFIRGNLMHAHLLGSSDKLFELNAGALLEATAVKWGKEHNFHYIHHGGGRSNEPQDALYMYKKKFGKNTNFDFYIGKKIWNKKLYDQFVMMSGNEETKNEDFFPLYRL